MEWGGTPPPPERKIRKFYPGKVHSQGLKMVVMYQLMLKMDQKGQNMYEKGLKIEFLGPKIPVLFAEFCSAEIPPRPGSAIGIIQIWTN